MVDISICIVSWNVKDLLDQCLDSIEEAQPRLEYEVLVVDNDSRDGSAALVKEKFPEVVLIQNDRNFGFAAACNQAMKRSRGQFILLLNPDTLIQPGVLEEMVRFLGVHPKAGAAGCRILNPDGSLQRSIRAFPTFKSSLGQFTILGDLGFFRKAKRNYFEEKFDYGRECEVGQPMGSALFLRRAAVEEIGWMDESFFLYFEEVDLCRRLGEAGYPIWYNPRARIIHFGGKSTEQKGAQSTFWLLKSQFHYLQKHYGETPTFWFKVVFKPLFTLGLLWGIVRNGSSLGGKYIFGASPERVNKTRKRLKDKWRFLIRYLIEFWSEV